MKFASIAFVVLAATGGTTANAQSLIGDGGFESPAVPAGSYTVFSVGQKIGTWTVVGDDTSSQAVSVMSGSFVSDGIGFNARNGKQYFNFGIPGFNGGTFKGIEQEVTTVPGSKYSLSFWLGAVYDPEGQGAITRVDVYVNGYLLTSAIQPGKINSISQKWNQFSAQFTAATDKTTIAFICPGQPPNNDALDDVQLVIAP
jgi:hypothetical protein